MKKIFTLAALCAVSALFGVNLIPNGDFKDPAGRKPYLQTLPKKGVDSALFSGKFMPGAEGKIVICSKSADGGSVAVNYNNLKTLEPDKRYYLAVKYLAASAGSKARISCRFIFNSGNDKPKYYFSPDQQIQESGVHDFICTFKTPAKLDKTNLTMWFAGIQQGEIKSIYLDTQLPAGDNPDGNLMRNGSFESSSLFEYYIRKKPANAPEVFCERSSVKAKSGKYSLLSSSSLPGGNTEINLNMLPFKSGVKYRFSTDYFVASATGKCRISGRVIFLDAAQKPIRYLFPVGELQPGKWNRMSLEFFPPPETARITVSLWFSGQLQTYIDDIWYGEVKETPAVQKKNNGAFAIVRNEAFTLWKEAPYAKVPYSGVPEMKSGSTVELSAAANETEPFQLVVSPKKNMTEVYPSFENLTGDKGVIPASAFSFKAVDFVNLQNPDNPAMKGFNADPLLEVKSIDAGAGRNFPFYIMVKVPQNTPAGVYSGKISLKSKDSVIAHVPLKVRVRNFALPDTASLRSYFYSRPSEYASLDSRPDHERIADIMTLLKQHRMNGNQGIPMPAPRFKISDGKLTVTDWSRFDARVEEFHSKYGMVNFPVPYFGMMGDNSGWFGGSRTAPRRSPFGKFGWLSPEGLKYAGEFAAEFTRHVKEKFPGLSFYAYIYDEPPAKVYDDLRKITNALHRAAPELKIFIPKQVNSEIGYVHTFCVPMAPGFVNLDLHAKAVAKGTDIWYYNWPVRLDNFDYIRNRLYPWQIYAADGIGGLLWNTMKTRPNINPWNQLDKTYLCGAATLFYPPKEKGGKMSTSLRAMQIQEGIDDFDYLKILERKIDKLYPGMGKIRVKEIIRGLITNAPFDFHNDPDLLYSLRNKIADEIEALDKAPAAVVVSNPANGTETELSGAELRILAPAGSKIAVNGKAVGTVDKSNSMTVKIQLEKFGKNPIVLAVNDKTFRREYIRRPDPKLKELTDLVSRAKSQNIPVKNAEKHLKNSASGIYNEESREATAKHIGQLKYALVERELKAKHKFPNELSRVVFERGKAAFARSQFDRAEYYLGLSRKIAESGNMDKFNVKVSGTDFQGHPAFVMDNGTVRAVILETGGRVISFKVKGVECLAPGSFSKGLTLEERAARKVTKDMVTRLSGYGGYEDARGEELMPISFADWDVNVPALKANQAALSFETRLPGTPFALKRTLSMRADSPDLRMDYEIVNVMPKGSISEDPEHYQFDWRGRFLPAVGDGRIPQEKDIIVMPLAEENKLAETHFNTAKPLYYERRSVKLMEPWMGVFDPAAKSGIAMIGDSQITHAYVWFNTKGNHRGEAKIYTMEFLRSFYGKKFDDKEANSPFTVKPGESLGFTVTLRGVSGVTTEQEFRRAIGR